MRLTFFASTLLFAAFGGGCAHSAISPVAPIPVAAQPMTDLDAEQPDAPVKVDRPERARLLAQKLNAMGLQATMDKDDDVVFRSGTQSYMLSTEKPHFFRLERPTKWSAKNTSDHTDMLRTLSKLNNDRRWVKFSYLPKSKVVTLGIEQLVATDDDMIALMPRALEYLKEAEKKMPSRVQRAPSVLGMNVGKAQALHVGAVGALARHYADMLNGEGTEADIDGDGDVVFAREGIKLFVSVHEDSPEYLRLVSLWGGNEFPGNEAKKLEVCNDINARVAVAKCSILRGDIVISSEQMLGDATHVSGQFKGGIRAISTAAHMLKEASGGGNTTSADPLGAPPNPANMM